MAFRIERVVLENFRSHELFVFTPSLEGVTALRGANGSGKTSIVSAVAWALYGHKPAGVGRNIDLRRKTAQKGDKTLVKVTLLVGDTRYVVERRMRGSGSAEGDVWRITPTGDLEHVAGQSIKDVTTYVQQLLGMDEAGFLTAVFFEQKNVDEFVHTKPANRREILEKLTGISGVSLALEENKTALRDVKAQIRGMSVDHVSLEDKKNRLTSLTQQHENAVHTVESLETKLAATENKLTLLLQEFQEKNQGFITYTNLTHAVNNLTDKVNTLEDRMNTLAARRKKLKKTVTMLGDSGDYTSIKNEYEELEEKATALATTINALTTTERQYTQEQEQLTTTISGWESREEVENEKTRVETLQAEQGRKQDTLSETLFTHKTLVASLTTAIDSITQVDGTCPTCYQEVNNKDQVITDLQTQREKATRNITQTETEIQNLTTEQNKTREELATITTVLDAHLRLNTLVPLIQDTQKELDKKQKEQAALKIEVDVHRDMYAEAKHAKTIHDELSAVNQEYKDTYTQHAAATQELTNTKNQLAETPKVIQNTLDTLNQRISKGRGISTRLQTTMRDATNKVSALKETMSALQENIRRDEAEAEKYGNLLRNQEALNHSLGVLSAFRQKVVDTSIPIMVSYASTLLGRFTQGTFVGVNITSDFAITVTRASGETVDVSLLSGGELSAVSMALGVAVSMMLSNGGGLNTIIFDEAFVSQDAARVDSILSTIKDVCDGGQVILIAHNDNIEAIVDTLINL